MFKIATPNKTYSGVTAGVLFTNGTGETTDKKILNQLLKEYGYEDVTKPEDKPKKASSKRKSASSKK
ncbi:hypothetical protein [Shouchella patagoniensis]|uniref:hypothetical protein n=1 Tax=Shouchella patagoniensis TaxID=228576 RepID=UPI000995C87C|nr:hypothetical protein [Shouchella patagoniensis]